METLTNTEEELYYWQMSNDATNFTSKLFELILKADRSNQYKLALGFPVEVEVVRRYQNEPGYWESIINKMQGK